ncbi:MAG: hypothetical protein K8963_11255, partial [Proteobacteria bacterium]|nr:hypothetical protein [Pseudomonadota bacterium]
INGKISTTALWIGWMQVAHLQHDSRQGRIDSITLLTTGHLGTPRLGHRQHPPNRVALDRRRLWH